MRTPDVKGLREKLPSKAQLRDAGVRARDFLSTRDGKLAAGGGVFMVALAIGVFFLLYKPGYRTIKIYEVDGPAEIERFGYAPSLPYSNMMLQNEDDVSTGDDGWLYLIMDASKYLLAEPETHFVLEATGTSAHSTTNLKLEKGALVSHVTKPLSEDSSYGVSTPNSVMAVRGTSFRVAVWYDDEGVSHTILQVFEGTVEVHLVYPDGTMSDEGRQIVAGQTATIWGDSSTSDYDSIVDGIDYMSMEIPTLEFLKVGISHSDDGYNITIPDVDEIIRLKNSRFPVTFMVDGKVFGTQSVQYDHCASEPIMRPNTSGSWDFDFSTKIHEPTEVVWKE